jgi:hypothetical protein
MNAVQSELLHPPVAILPVQEACIVLRPTGDYGTGKRPIQK